jgi:hypothetical protein
MTIHFLLLHLLLLFECITECALTNPVTTSWPLTSLLARHSTLYSLDPFVNHINIRLLCQVDISAMRQGPNMCWVLTAATIDARGYQP